MIPTRFFRDRKGTPKNFSDKDLAELSDELFLVRFASNTFLLRVMTGNPLELSRNSLALFVRFFGFGVLLGS